MAPWGQDQDEQHDKIMRHRDVRHGDLSPFIDDSDAAHHMAVLRAGLLSEKMAKLDLAIRLTQLNQ